MSITPRLTRFDLTMIVISLVIGMGIFANPSEVAVRAGNPWVFFGVWIFGGLVTLCGALTFAEIGARYPSTGGFYKVYSYCYHPAFAFMINWVLVISNAASVAVVALIGADYINPMILPAHWQTPFAIKAMALFSVLILYVLAFMGIKVSARAQNLLTAFKVLMILLLCVVVFKNDTTHVVTQYVPAKGNLVTAIGLSLVPIFFTYGGYQQTINFGGDIIEAKQNIPKAIAIGISTVIVAYLAINFAYYKVLGLGGLQQTTTLASTLAGVLFGSWGAKLASVMMFISVLAYINVNVMANPRVYYAMSEDGILPQIFRKVNPKTQVQEFGMTFFVICIVLILFFADSFRKMLDYVMFFDTIGLSIAALSIFILRKRTKQMDGTGIYTIKWFPLVPIVFILAYWFVTVNIFITFKSDPWAAVKCLGCYVLGLVIYYAAVGRRKKAELR
jgi:basic amino acid/polyamine antiporter, APA family